MKQIAHSLLAMALLLWLIAGGNIARAQIINGGFELNNPGYGGCPGAVWAWNEGPVPGSIQWENQWDNGNWWLDITGCGWGNGRWIEQPVPTVAGKKYRLTFDLGCWNGQYYTDAGAIVSLNGSSIGRYAHTAFTGTSTAPLAWKRFDTCFTATATTTTIRFTADGLPTYASPPGTTTANVGVIGLDNANLQALDSAFKLTFTRSGCNYCFNLGNPFVKGPQRPYATNIQWYLDGVLKHNGDTTWCITVPSAPSAEMMVIYTVSSACGTIIDTIKQTLIAEPTYTGGGSVILNTVCGQTTTGYTPACGSSYTSYRLTTTSGTLLSSGSLPLGSPLQLGPGTYVFTCIQTGTCSTIYYRTVVYVIPPLMSEITGDDVTINVCGQRTAEYTPDCSAPYNRYTLTGLGGYSSSGPLPAPSLSLPAGSYQLICYDDINCVQRVSNVTVNAITTPIESFCTVKLSSCEQLDDSKYIYQQVAEACPDCAAVLDNAQTISPVTILSYNESTQMLTVTREYYDEVNCKKCTITFLIFMRVTTCEVEADCSAVRDNRLEEYVGDKCGDCAGTVANATWTSPLNSGYYDSHRNAQIMTRTYVDIKNCTVCKISYVIPIKETICKVKLDHCSQLADGSLEERIKESCPDCKETIDHATWVLERNPSYDEANQILTITREYYDFDQCHKCTIVLEIQNYVVPVITIEATEPCITISRDMLPDCFRDKKIVNVVPMANPRNPGNQGATVKVDISKDQIRLCCREKNLPYYIYSEEDPCCAVIIKLNCNEKPGVEKAKKGMTSGQRSALLRLVPNPASTIFRIASGNAEEQYKQIDVLDINGRVVLSRTNADERTTIDMTPFSRGTYIVKVTTETGDITVMKLTLIKD